MRVELKRVSILSCVKVAALIYALIGLLAGGLFSLFALIGSAVGGQGFGEAGVPGLGLIMGVGAVVFFPIFYGTLGAIVAAVTALIYNLIAGLVGGIEVELKRTDG